MKWLEELFAELKELLPTKGARLTAGISIALSIGAWNLPSHLPLPEQFTQPLTLFLIKLLLSISALLIGEFLIICMVVRHSNSLQRELDNKDQFCDARIAEIKAACDPVNNLKPGEALITENIWSGNPIIKKIDLPS